MQPTLSPGMIVLATTIFLSLDKGDLVAISHPKTNKILIKRIHDISKHGIDVRGDNTTSSTDSRQFGLLPRNKIIAKVFSFW
jgi:nickel-type superoxide dismutase maturation protease